MTELTDPYARDYEDSILQEVRDNPFFQVGMHVIVYALYYGVITKYLGFYERQMTHAYAVETDEDGYAACVFECDLQRITERKLVLVKS